MTHSSRSAPWAALPLLAVSVWGGAGPRWPVCSKPRCHWRRPAACGGPLSCFWRQWRSLWSRYLGDRWTRDDSTVWRRPSASWALTESESALWGRPPERRVQETPCCHWRAVAAAWTSSWRWARSVCCCLWGWWASWACPAAPQLRLASPAGHQTGLCNLRFLF